MKVFDCQDMPDNVREVFFEHCSSGNSVSNDCYVDWYSDTFYDEEYCEKIHVVTSWLISQGATKDEHVLIRHWW